MLSQSVWAHGPLHQLIARYLPANIQWLSAPIAHGLLRAFPGGVAPDAGRIADFCRERPELQRLWLRPHSLAAPPHHVLDAPTFLPDQALAGLCLPRLADTLELADWLAISPEQLTRFADLRSLSALCPSEFARHYRTRTIPKKDGTPRLIEEPKPFLKTLQRRILSGILNAVAPHSAAHGFTPRRNCLSAASRHAGEETVVSFDLADFFQSISFSRVYSTFRALGYPAAVARTLCGLATVITPPDERLRHAALGRHLPQGAPTSPALANLAAFGLDRRLAGLARRIGAAYTRYADDLTFSGDRQIGPILLRAVPQIAHDEGFRLNRTKTRLMPRGGRQIVTGTVVNSHLNLPRTEYDQLKATLHRLADPTDPRRADLAFRAHIRGRIAWAEQVNPARAQKLRTSFDALGFD